MSFVNLNVEDLFMVYYRFEAVRSILSVAECRNAVFGWWQRKCAVSEGLGREGEILG